jgi:hypothetical protein
LPQSFRRRDFVQKRCVDGRILRTSIKEIVWGNLDGIELACYRIQWGTNVCVYVDAPLGCMKCRDFNESLNDSELLKRQYSVDWLSSF